MGWVGSLGLVEYRAPDGAIKNTNTMMKTIIVKNIMINKKRCREFIRKRETFEMRKRITNIGIKKVIHNW